MKKILILIFILSLLPTPVFAGSSVNYSFKDDMFVSAASIGLKSANYSIADVLGANAIISGAGAEDYNTGGAEVGDSTVWYLAEGCTNGFDTYVLIQNPNSQAASVLITFMNQNGATAEVSETIAGTKRYTIHVNTVPGFEACDVSTTVISKNQIPVRVERAMYWDSGDLSWAGGHNSIGITSPSTSWYLAEGCTNGFDEYVLFQNPNTATAAITAVFMDPDGNTAEVAITLAGQRRYTIHVNAVVGMENRDVSTAVTSDIPINVERSMYWGSGEYNWIGGHVSIGVTAPATSWYLAEGCTRGFDEYVLFQNPGTTTANISATFMDQDGQTTLVPITLAGQSRYTVHVNNVTNMNERDVSVSVTSDAAINVERAMYWDSGELTWAGGHDSVGVTAPASIWYLAEGCTRGFDEYVLFQNPGTTTANITATFMDQDGITSAVSFTLDAQKRYTINVNSVENMDARDVSVTVNADVPINVERAMYWSSGDYTWIGGHDSCGMRQF